MAHRLLSLRGRSLPTDLRFGETGTPQPGISMPGDSMDPSIYAAQFAA